MSKENSVKNGEPPEHPAETFLNPVKKTKKRIRYRRLLIRSGKLCLWGLGVLIALLLLVLLFRNQIAKIAIERYCSYLFGTEVRVEKISSNIFNGKIHIVNLEIKNPVGFRSEYFLRIDGIFVNAKMLSLLTSRIVLQEIRLDNVEIDGEFNSKGTMNAVVLNEHISRTAPAEDKEIVPETDPNATPATYLISDFRFSGKINIRDDSTGINLPFACRLHLRDLKLEDDGETIIQWMQSGIENFIEMAEGVRIGKFSEKMLQMIPDGGKSIIDGGKNIFEDVKNAGKKVIDLILIE